ncbi:MAG: hypothetical protein LUD52_06050 [Opitutae bacterium]|nr:hypothetical protein [Opitutae bacterium]
MLIRIGDNLSDEDKQKATDDGLEVATLHSLIMKFFGSGSGVDILKKIMQGETTYPVANATYNQTTYKSGIDSLLNNVGKKQNPSGPNPGGEWIYVGATAQKSATDRRWKVTKEWQMGDNGKVDSTIIKSA